MTAYYRWFPGDYIRDTIHLGWVEDCAYRRLIDLYQIHGRPIRNDRAYIMRAVRANEPEQQAAVDSILVEYFELRLDGWHQKKCDSEIAFRVDAVNHAKKAAEARWKNKRNEINVNGDARALLGQSSGYANQNQNQNQIKVKSKPISSEPAKSRRSKPVLGEGELIQTLPSTRGDVEVRKSWVMELIDAYPAVMVAQEVDRAKLWLEANPTKRKSNVQRFLTNWMARTQERGGSR